MKGDVMSYADDIPLDLAIRAHAGTSHVPERRGEQERADYARTLEADWQALSALSALATTDDKRATLVAEWSRYREGFRKLCLASLEARSRCVSTMIAGGSGFNARRAQKHSDAADKRNADVIEYRARALAAIRKALTPELRPIMAGDADAIERTRAKLANSVRIRDLMKTANKIIRKHDEHAESVTIEALKRAGLSDDAARDALKVDAFGNVGFAPYVLTNAGAEIRRLKAKLATLETTKTQPDTAIEGERAKLEDSPAENRVRLFFPSKPDAETIARLKRAGFRWSPKSGAWSAYRTALHAAREIAGVT
jgi:hypothetical protein